MSKPHKIMGKKAIFFDVNETLIRQGIHFEQAFHTVWSEFSARWQQSNDENGDELWERYQALWQQHKKATNSRIPFDLLQRQCLQDALKELQVPVYQGFAEDFFQSVRKQRMAAKSLAKGVEGTLRILSSDYKLAIISNSPHSEVTQLLNRFGLQTFFTEDRIFTAQKQSEKKPGLSLFKMALQSLGLTPRQAVMVGNSWKHDICGAAKAGLDAVWLQTYPDNTTTKVSQQKLGKRNIYHIQQMDQLRELFQ
jgi:putative hydrolase of the HAD superfamily